MFPSVGKVIFTSIKKLFSSLLGYRCLWIIFLHLICATTPVYIVPLSLLLVNLVIIEVAGSYIKYVIRKIVMKMIGSTLEFFFSADLEGPGRVPNGMREL
ncbi:hypothetical protein EYC80_008827 [Monilinia laxa]|uniref:Uncharacterized protein n=1 Tax=Monilinia laxa TaxID=61186 RepID=A0A5N6K1K9_MONLA|nr:hypothetical protein EYC80_008827 [Monilinia laxa]